VRILFVATEHEYGDPALGPSFERMNFHSALAGMGHDVAAFDFLARERAIGRDAMNRELERTAAEAAPDLVFFFLHEDQIAPRTIERIGAHGLPTVNWFADDHWRFATFSRHYASALTWSVTTDHDAVARYHAAGVDRVIVSQWACNRYAYDRVPDAPLELDVSFVGQPHGNRREIAERVRAAGFDLRCFGNGWEHGRISHDEMVRLFSTTRVNLNLSNASTPNPTLRMRLGAYARGRRPDTAPRPDQIKGRTFEVPGSGGFLLTSRVAHLEDYFELGKEIAVFSTPDELIEQIGFWLAHPDERAAVADAAYQRVRAEHTYDHRFAAVFERMGLS
jgi:spore maturation protein CgeB